MRRAWILGVALLAVSGPACQAKGNGVSPMVPKFIQADNGLAAAAAWRAGNYVSTVILHFLGMDPPLVWVPPPRHEEMFAGWMDDPVAMPASLTAQGAGTSKCGAIDLSRLAVRLQMEPPAANPSVPEGQIRLDQSAPISHGGDIDLRAAPDGCISPDD